MLVVFFVGNPFKCNSISIYFGLKIKIARCISILPNSFFKNPFLAADNIWSIQAYFKLDLL